MSEMKREDSRKSITGGPILEGVFGIESPVTHVPSLNLETEIDFSSWRNQFLR
jgi:hypothetical protein